MEPEIDGIGCGGRDEASPVKQRYECRVRRSRKADHLVLPRSVLSGRFHQLDKGEIGISQLLRVERNNRLALKRFDQDFPQDINGSDRRSLTEINRNGQFPHRIEII